MNWSSLNVTGTATNFTITSTGAASTTLTLTGSAGANPVAPDPNDAIYLADNTNLNMVVGSGGATAFSIFINPFNGVAKNIDIGANSTLTVFRFTGTAASQGFTKTGSGTLAFNSGIVSFTGPVTLAQGTIKTAPSGASLGGGSFNMTGGTLDIGAASFSFSGSAAATGGVVTTSAASGTQTIGFANSGSVPVAYGNLEFSGVLQDGPTAKLGLSFGAGSASGLNAGSTFNYTIDGNNTFSGPTLIRYGTVFIGSNSALGTSTVTMGVTGGTSGALVNANLEFSSTATALTSSNNISVTGAPYNGTATLGGLNTSGTNTFSGNITLGTGNTATANTTVLHQAAGGTVVFSGSINDSGTNGNSVVLDGPGTVVLSGTSGYTGSTTVSAGSLLVQGGLNAASTMSVARGATLGVGKAAGGISFKTLTVASLSTGVVGISGTESTISLSLGGGTNDKLVSTGAFNLNGAPVKLMLTAAGTITSGTYTLITWVTGGFTDLSTQLDLSGSPDFNLSEFSIGGGGTSLLFTAAVPEPTTCVLFGAGVLALWEARRRRRS